VCDEKLPNLGHLPYTDISRRQFAALAAAASGAGLAGAAQAQAAVVARDVSVRTPDGVCDAVLFHPEGRGQWPGVLFWPDAGGLRPVKRDMGKRLAGQGYAVLVVNPYYRTDKAPAMSALNNQIPADQAKRTAARAAMTPEAIARDAKAFVGYLDALPQTSRAKVGVQGYCMGGALSVRTAASVPDRIGAVCSFHGGNGLVTADPNSPHLLIEKTNARYLFAHARNDDAANPAVKGGLREALYKAGKPGLVDVYQANHGWCVPDGAQYHQAEAERGWSTLTDIYARSLI
jgi:carboxymethylenebutenolidase